jgi:hypothetical protein
MEDGIRSEEDSLREARKALTALKEAKTKDQKRDLAISFLFLFADARCRCEEKEAAYGEDALEPKTCYNRVAAMRDEIVEAFDKMLMCPTTTTKEELGFLRNKEAELGKGKVPVIHVFSPEEWEPVEPPKPGSMEAEGLGGYIAKHGSGWSNTP